MSETNRRETIVPEIHRVDGVWVPKSALDAANGDYERSEARLAEVIAERDIWRSRQHDAVHRAEQAEQERDEAQENASAFNEKREESDANLDTLRRLLGNPPWQNPTHTELDAVAQILNLYERQTGKDESNNAARMNRYYSDEPQIGGER